MPHCTPYIKRFCIHFFENIPAHYSLPTFLQLLNFPKLCRKSPSWLLPMMHDLLHWNPNNLNPMLGLLQSIAEWWNTVLRTGSLHALLDTANNPTLNHFPIIRFFHLLLNIPSCSMSSILSTVLYRRQDYQTPDLFYLEDRTAEIHILNKCQPLLNIAHLHKRVENWRPFWKLTIFSSQFHPHKLESSCF